MIEKIKQDQMAARKRYIKSKNSIDDLQAKLLTTLLGEATMPGKEQDIIKVVTKFIKGAKEVLELGDEHQVARAEAEIELLNRYIPKQLTKTELTDIIKNIDSTNIGIIMKELNKNYKGKFDGKLAMNIIKEI